MVQGNVEVSQTDLGLLFYWKQRSFWSCYTLLLVFCICSLKEEVQIHCAGGLKLLLSLALNNSSGLSRYLLLIYSRQCGLWETCYFTGYFHFVPFQARK